MRNSASTKVRSRLVGGRRSTAKDMQSAGVAPTGHTHTSSSSISPGSTPAKHPHAKHAHKPLVHKAPGTAQHAPASPARINGKPNRRQKHHFSPLAILGTALAGGLFGLLLITNLYPLQHDNAPNSGTAPSINTAAATFPLLLASAHSTNAAASASVADDKADLGAQLLTSFASLSSSSAATDTPLILQASLTVDEPVSDSTEILKSPPPEPVDKTFVLKKGEVLANKLVDLGVSLTLASMLVEQLDRTYPLHKIRPGTRFVVTLEQQPDFSGMEVTYPVYLAFSPRPGQQVVVETDDEGQFVARLQKRPNKARSMLANADYIHVRGRISSSLYAAAKDQGVPDYIITQMLRALSHQLDLQRQVHKGDTFEILFGKPFSGTSSRRKVLHYAALTHKGRTISFYRYTTPDGKTAYFDAKGRSARRGLMRTPISGARISSGFGMRRHPVLGYTKMHTGVDFAAPTGTPIRAAGSGTVIHAGWRGGYGRTVMIKHPNGYITLYAHQSRIARGIRKGVKVRQGQVIGYVGATGRVTGPHLHFEVRINGRKVNPLRVRTATRQQLKGKALKRFRSRMARINKLLEKIPVATQVASK